MKIELSLYCMKELDEAVRECAARNGETCREVSQLENELWAALKPYLFGDRIELEFGVAGGKVRTATVRKAPR